jgi:hypothetical protein
MGGYLVSTIEGWVSLDPDLVVVGASSLKIID